MDDPALAPEIEQQLQELTHVYDELKNKPGSMAYTTVAMRF